MRMTNMKRFLGATCRLNCTLMPIFVYIIHELRGKVLEEVHKRSRQLRHRSALVHMAGRDA